MEVGLLVKACTQQIEQLKNSVLAAQGHSAAPAASTHAMQHAAQGRGPGPAINAQTAAHLHGVVRGACAAFSAARVYELCVLCLGAAQGCGPAVPCCSRGGCVAWCMRALALVLQPAAQLCVAWLLRRNRACMPACSSQLGPPRLPAPLTMPPNQCPPRAHARRRCCTRRSCCTP